MAEKDAGPKELKVYGAAEKSFSRLRRMLKLGPRGFHKGTIMMPMPFETSTLLILTVAEALFAIPAGLVLRRIGISFWWALLCFIPVAALLGLWVLALTSWTPRAVKE